MCTFSYFLWQGLFLFFYMNVEIIIQTLNELVHQEAFLLAEYLILQHPQYHQNIAFNDVYATVLYFLDKHTQALAILDFNIERILHHKANESWLIASYFQKANCYLALNNTPKAHYYFQKVLDTQDVSSPLYQEINQLLFF